MTYRKKCANPECDVIFESVYPQQKYCLKCGFSRVGVNSHPKHPRPKVKKICPICGEEFIAPKGCNALGRPYQIYCSTECQQEASRQRKIAFKNKWCDGTPVR